MEFSNIPPKWDEKGTEPTTELQTSGFKAGYKPPAAFFNYLFNKITACLSELQTKLSGTDTTLNNHTSNTSNPHSVTKAQVGLGNVNNTSDANKPVSTAQAAAIADAKGTVETALNNHTSNTNNPHSVTKAQVGLSNVPNVATNDQTPTYTAASSNTALASGEKLSVAMGKIAKAVSSLISHLANTSNPHSVTKDQVGLSNVPNVATNDQTPTYSDTTTLATLSSGEKLNVALQKIKCAITSLIGHINTHKLQTFTSLDDTGQTYGKETIAGIAEGMPSNSELIITVGEDNAAIYPQTYGVLHVLKKDNSRVVFKFYSKTTAYEYLGIYDNSQTTAWSGWKYTLGEADVVDNLTTAANKQPLSAKQGKVLNDAINELESTLNAKIDWFAAGKSISSGSDLDNYRENGKYMCSSTSTAGTLLNSPVTNDNFVMYVFKRTSGSSINQLIITLNSMLYIRGCNSSGTMRDWQRFVTENNLDTLKEEILKSLSDHTGDTSNPHKVTKAQVGLGNVPNVATNDQTPTYSDTTTLATLASGEKLNVALQKIKYAITTLINHVGNKENPHSVTAAQLGALPLAGGTLTERLKIANKTAAYTRLHKNEANNTDYGTYLQDSNASGKVTNLVLSAQGYIDNGAEYAVRFIDHNNVSYSMLGTHNKPSGSYTGNNSATNRTVSVGGLGENLVITSDTGTAWVSSRGAICMDRQTGEISALKSWEVYYKNGTLTISTDSAFVNASQSYWYQVL